MREKPCAVMSETTGERKGDRPMIKRLLNRLMLRKDPVAYWRKRGVKIGADCEIYSSAHFGSEPYLVSLGDHVRINANVSFVTHDGGVWVLRRYLKTENAEKIDMFGKIKVGSNVHIGTGVTVMPGVSIGSNCIIGVGAIVTRDIPDNSVVVGVPARVIETVEEYAQKHMDDFLYTKGMSAAEKRLFLEKTLGQ